jgi:hypothetical protein
MDGQRRALALCGWARERLLHLYQASADRLDGASGLDEVPCRVPRAGGAEAGKAETDSAAQVHSCCHRCWLRAEGRALCDRPEHELPVVATRVMVRTVK